MIARRVVINLVVFFAVSAALVTYGAVTFFGNPLTEPRTIVAELPEAGGLRSGFSASHDGVVIGTVSGIDLTADGVRIEVELDPGQTVPSGVEARIVRASAVGEQRLDFVTASPPEGRVLADGAVVGSAPLPLPPDVAEVLSTTNDLVEALPADDLNTLVHELAVALDGRADDLRSMTRSLAVIGDDLVAVEPDLRAVLEDGPEVLDAFTAMSPEVHSALESTRSLTRLLADRREDLVALLRDGGDVAEIADRVLLENGEALTCLVSDLAAINGVLGREALGDLDRALESNQLFFGAVDRVSVRGAAADVGYGPAIDDALWLRTRLLVPPGSPAASRYVPPRGPRPVLEGEACDADVFSASPTAGPDAAGPPAAAEPAPGLQDRTEAVEPVPGDEVAAPAPDRSPADPADGGGFDHLAPLAIGLAVLGFVAFLVDRNTRRST